VCVCERERERERERQEETQRERCECVCVCENVASHVLFLEACDPVCLFVYVCVCKCVCQCVYVNVFVSGIELRTCQTVCPTCERLNERDGERAHESVIARGQDMTGEKAA